MSPAAYAEIMIAGPYLWRRLGAEGFVRVAIVIDMKGHGDVFSQFDDEIEAWE